MNHLEPIIHKKYGGDYDRIHRLPFRVWFSKRQIVLNAQIKQAFTSVLFTAAIFATIGRIIIRLRYQFRLFANDYVLLFGCSSLIAAFVLVHCMFEKIYFEMALILDSYEVVLYGVTFEGFEKAAIVYQ